MIEIGIYGCGFEHSTSSTLYKTVKDFKWIYNQTRDITFWCDHAIERGVDSFAPNKMAWLIESQSIVPNAFKFVKENYKLISKSYQYLFTYDEELLNLAPNFKLMLPHGFWLDSAQLYPKSKLVSMISSNKSQTQGQRKRLEWVEKLKGKVDLYGRGFNDFDRHEDALCDYYFSIVIENEQGRNFYITEKLLSTLAAGTVPVYLGSRKLEQFFNTDGIIALTDDFDISLLTPELYHLKMDAILDNLERVKQYNVIEDILWEKYINKIL